MRRSAASALIAAISLQTPLSVAPVRWLDLLPATQQRLRQTGVDAASFEGVRDNIARATRERVREGDLDALIYYVLQSTAFTSDPPIEPALSAKTFVEALDGAVRQRYLSGASIPARSVPPAVVRRCTEFLAAIERTPASKSRLAAFRDVLQARTNRGTSTASFLLDQYVRVMRFLYLKEFVAQTNPQAGERVAALYAARGLSTDTAVEAGYLTYLGLGMLRGADSARAIREVLIIGPGLDLAPRTDLIEAGPPESYQPYMLLDALLATGLSRPDDLRVLGADVNPRVVAHLEAARRSSAQLLLVTGIGNRAGVSLADDYRRYFESLGASVGTPLPVPRLPAPYDGHLRKSLLVPAGRTGLIAAVQLDVTTTRITNRTFDLVVATNVFPYFDDMQLALAIGNIARMLAPGGVLLHNESRPLVGSLTAEAGLPLTHSRSAVIATVPGAATPLGDSVFIHQKTGTTGTRNVLTLANNYF